MGLLCWRFPTVTAVVGMVSASVASTAASLVAGIGPGGAAGRRFHGGNGTDDTDADDNVAETAAFSVTVAPRLVRLTGERDRSSDGADRRLSV